MLSGTPAQSFLALQRPHENDSRFKSIFQWLAALLATATPVPGRLQPCGGIYTLLNKRFPVAIARERKQPGFRKELHLQSLPFLFVLTHEFHAPDFSFHHKQQKIVLYLPPLDHS